VSPNSEDHGGSGWPGNRGCNSGASELERADSTGIWSSRSTGCTRLLTTQGGVIFILHPYAGQIHIDEDHPWAALTSNLFNPALINDKGTVMEAH